MIRRLFSRSSLIRPAKSEVDLEEGRAYGRKQEVGIVPADSAEPRQASSEFSRRKPQSRDAQGGSRWRSFKSLLGGHKGETQDGGEGRPPEYQMEQVVVEKEEEIGSPRDGRVKVAWDSKPAVKVSKIPHKRWEVDEEVLRMAKYLGIKDSEDYLLGIAEEALNASLPSGWEERCTAEGYPYYFCTANKTSSWEHPNDRYYRFLVKSIRKIRQQRVKKGPQVARSPEVRRDRELADSSWRLHEEEKQREEEKKSLRLSEEQASAESIKRAESALACSKKTQKLVEYLGLSEAELNAPVSVDEVSAPTPQFILFSSSFPSLPSSHLYPTPTPTALLCSALSFAAFPSPCLQASSSISAPPILLTIFQVCKMCEYLGIGGEESFLVPLAVSALQAPIPKEWTILKDKQGVPFYCNKRTKETSYRHPSDEVFMQRVKRERNNFEEMTRSERERLLQQHRWMKFEENGKSFWYNFASNQRKFSPPPTDETGS
mmetsp:Transcript_2934/g.7056  ORF Transcript_2934/g.7056 Transcript_2934/m.7056 type:complete len:488 (-) Transcript_2934:1948-3411(-)